MEAYGIQSRRQLPLHIRDTGGLLTTTIYHLGDLTIYSMSYVVPASGWNPASQQHDWTEEG
jgi:hypothetical protein